MIDWPVFWHGFWFPYRFLRAWWGFRHIAWETATWRRDDWVVMDEPAEFDWGKPVGKEKR